MLHEDMNGGSKRECVDLVARLKICVKRKDLCGGIKIHGDITKRGLLEQNPHLACTIVSMYAKCGVPNKAWEVFETLAQRDAITWNALMTGYLENGQGYNALHCFDMMHFEGLSPDAVTFICSLKACGSTRSITRGDQNHEEIVHRGFLMSNVALGTALVDMYVKCDALTRAWKVLEELPVRNVVSWNALISGYADHGQVYESMNCFQLMQCEGIFTDTVSFICILKVCGNNIGISEGRKIHMEIVNRGLLDKHTVLGNALVDMYSKCGFVMEAHEVLKSLPDQNVISWSSLIAGYAQHGQSHEALNCFEQMLRKGIAPNMITFTCVLKACGTAGALDKGKRIEEQILSRGLLDKDPLLGTALVDMYAKCGALAKAQDVLEGLPERNVACWNAVIGGYAQKGDGRKALNNLEQMLKEGIFPDEVTFLCILSACSHSGLLYDAEILLEIMIGKYGISPNVEHHTCMVMAFGYAGVFDKAMLQVKNMPPPESPAVWHVLLGACRKWGNLKLGKLAFDQAIQLDMSCAAAYILMSSIFSAAGMWQDAEKVEAMRSEYAA